MDQPQYIYQAWPAWHYGPNGEAEIFNAAEEVPPGWTTTIPGGEPPEEVPAAKRGPGRPPKAPEPAEELF